jgi:hypothetical protein
MTRNSSVNKDYNVDMQHSSSNSGTPPKPQMALNADKPGAYSLVVQSTQSHVSPGDSVKIRVFISGYGIIRGPKLRIQPPPGLFEEKDSKVFFDLGEIQSGELGWGTSSMEYLVHNIS